MIVIAQTHTTFYDPFEELLRQLIERIDDTVREVAIESRDFGRHEEPTTSRLAGAITSALRNHPITVPGLALDVHIEEFTKPEEHINGADLYISLVRKDEAEQVSKGMLVQSKRREAMLRSDEPQRLGNQCKRMRRRSKDASYVWIFEDDNVRSVKAPQASQPLLQRVTEPSSVGELIAKGLRCSAGDKVIGRDLSTDARTGVLAEMRRLSVPTGIELAVRSD